MLTEILWGLFTRTTSPLMTVWMADLDSLIRVDAAKHVYVFKLATITHFCSVILPCNYTYLHIHPVKAVPF
jgi:hypothetical protein